MSYTKKITNELIRDEKLKANIKVLLLVLLTYENEDIGYSYPSQTRLIKETGLSKVTLLKCLNELEEKGYITRVKAKGGNNKYFINTSTKNSTTKAKTSTKNSTTTSTKNSTQQLRNTNNNKKEQTNIDEIILTYTNNELLIETIKDFIKMRKSIKKPLTERGLKGILKNLDGLSNNDLEKIEILENSIINSWAGVFEIKSHKNSIGNGIKNSNTYKTNTYDLRQNYSSGREML